MDFDLSPDQVALRDAAGAFLDDLCDMATVRLACANDGFNPDLWEAMIEQGWIAITVAESLGGVGLGPVEAAILLEQSGAHLAPVPLAQQLIALGAMTDQPWLERLMTGQAVASVARNPVMRAADGTVTGRPEPVVYGARSDVLVIPAGDELVAVDLAGTKRQPEPAMDRTRELAWVNLNSAPAVTIGGPDEVTAHLNRGAVFHAAEMLGTAETVMRLAVDYAKVREQFGRPIGSFQAVKHRCADMLVDTEAMRSVVYYAAWALSADPAEAPVAAATAKIWCSDAGLRVAESALQVHGGIGFTWESDVHLFLKRAQLDQVCFGDARHHRSRLATMLRDRLDSGSSIWADPLAADTA